MGNTYFFEYRSNIESPSGCQEIPLYWNQQTAECPQHYWRSIQLPTPMMYQDAINKAGYKYQLKYEKGDMSHLNWARAPHNRRRREFCYNPPWDDRVLGCRPPHRRMLPPGSPTSVSLQSPHSQSRNSSPSTTMPRRTQAQSASANLIPGVMVQPFLSALPPRPGCHNSIAPAWHRTQ